MLPDYDARAVADVLGLAFVQVQRNSRQSPSIKAFIIGGDERFVVVEQAVDQRPDRIDRSLNRLAPSAAYIERAVETGLPRVALRRLVELLGGNDKSKISALEWDVVPRTTLERRKSKLSPEESERTERIARLFVRSRGALGTEAEAREFMTSPHPELDGKTPFEAARTDLGGRRVETILNALQYGLAV
jgi:putative toxin-antitoxin system antitoxin component (TIGR02293 family)